jgi:hypothetical protein
MKMFSLTPAAGKRLIAGALAQHLMTTPAVRSGTIVIIAGTTNGYLAEELLNLLGQSEGFSRRRFFRGITLPPTKPLKETGRLPDEEKFPGDVVISNGVWRKGLTIFDVVDELKDGDIVIKGANALDLEHRKAAILIGDSKAGTIGAAWLAVVGRRVRLILPVGLEKRVPGDLDQLAMRLNAPGASGVRLFPVSGEIITEIDALEMLTGMNFELAAAGGVAGAEGAIWLLGSGSPEQELSVQNLIRPLAGEPLFRM